MRDSKSQGSPGSPRWWASRSPAPGGARRGRPRRSLEPIVGAALEIIDEAGAKAFNMRLLAERLDSGTATLYRHLAGKDELLAYVVDRILGEVRAEADAVSVAATNWKQAAALSAQAFNRVLARHPNALALFASQVPVGPNGLAIRERSIAILLTDGFPPRLAARAYTAIANYVVGFAMQQHAPGSLDDKDKAELRRFYSALDAEVYPATLAASHDLTSVSPEEEFQFGLHLILDGIEIALGGSRHRRPAGSK